jgi:hypothetical protein
VKFSQTTFLTRSSLKNFGVHKQSLIRYIHPRDDVEVIVSEEHQYYWNCRLIGYGFHLKQYPRTIIPSLSVYPVVSNLRILIDSTMKDGNILEFQQMLSSGSLHPFTRSPRGLSLLHVRPFQLLFRTPIHKMNSTLLSITEATSAAYCMNMVCDQICH